MNIHLISAALPPALDGIGDYTALLAGELARTSRVTLLTGQAGPDAIENVTVQTAFSGADPASVWGVLAPLEAASPDWVVLQYNPFSYGRWGLNLSLPRVMAAVKRRCPRTRIALMAHEHFALPVTTWQFALMNVWQRWQFWRLGQAADLLFFSMETSAVRFRRWFPKTPRRHLPVGSNLPRVPLGRAEARARLGIDTDTLVLGLFGTAHVSRMLDRVGMAARAASETGRRVCVLSVGPGSDTLRQAVGDATRSGDLMLIADGPAAAPEVSRRLAAMDLYLLPFADGISTRRGTLMAGLQHGMAAVGTRGCHTDTVLRDAGESAFLLADVTPGAAFAAQVRRLAGDATLQHRLGQNAQALYEREFSWPHIGARMLEAMTECS